MVHLILFFTSVKGPPSISTRVPLNRGLTVFWFSRIFIFQWVFGARVKVYKRNVNSLGNAQLALSVVTYSNQAAWYPTTLLWLRWANTLTSRRTCCEVTQFSRVSAGNLAMKWCHSGEQMHCCNCCDPCTVQITSACVTSQIWFEVNFDLTSIWNQFPLSLMNSGVRR